jgi:hypothetical protein
MIVPKGRASRRASSSGVIAIDHQKTAMMGVRSSFWIRMENLIEKRGYPLATVQAIVRIVLHEVRASLLVQ